MKCEFVRTPDGGTAIVCSRGRRRHCAFCDRPSTKLCDGPPTPGSRVKTCSKPLCSDHARHVEGADLDYCPDHQEEAMRQRGGPQHIRNLFTQCDALNRARAGAPSPSGEEVPNPDTTTREPTRSEPAAQPPPLGHSWHAPKRCVSCGALIFWGQLNSGKSMPVDAEPTQTGNVLLFDRDGQVIARVLRKGEARPRGTKLRTSHFSTCPNASQHRRRL